MERDIILGHLNLLLVDDDHHNNAELYALFSSIFQHITLAQDGEMALSILDTSPVDIMITDIEMRGMSGLQLIERIRDLDTTIPIIILSAHSDQASLLHAANLQVDGYITKPLNFGKLEAALDRAVRRLEHRIKPVSINQGVSYHPLQKALQVDGQEVSLGSKERRLLELLVNNRHRVVSKEEIHEAVWPDEIVSESALKNLLGELRKKLQHDVIKNRPGQGWTLETRSA